MKNLRHYLELFFCVLMIAGVSPASAQTVVDLDTRPGVSQRLLVLSAPEPKASVILLAGGHGGLQMGSDGSVKWGAGNFLVRSRDLFVQNGLRVIVLDAPSDRLALPGFLNGFRQTDEHVADVKAVIAWSRRESNTPVWLVGTSRGTQSAAYIATRLNGAEGPDGIVLTSTILSDERTRPVPAMALADIKVPVLLVHHELDACGHCAYALAPAMIEKLVGAPRKQLLAVTGGTSRGDPCEAFAYHGFNGKEPATVKLISDWIQGR